MTTINLSIELLKQKVAKIKDTATERSYYPPLCSFIEEYAKSVLKWNSPCATPEETSKQYEKHVGFPDITVRNANSLIGWIEVKSPKEILSSEKFNDQFARYKDSLENIIFTNLREWQLWQWKNEEGESSVYAKKTAELIFDLTCIDGADSHEFEHLLIKFFEGRAYQTRTPKQLALALAKKTRFLSKQVEEALETHNEDSDLGKLKETFEKTLIQDISEHQFANMVAETMAYSLFLAALEHSRRDNNSELTLTNAIDYLPASVPILADLYSLVKKVSSIIPNIYEATRLLVDQLNASEIERIHQKLVEHKPGEDPVIQFYEPFLKEYDPKEREARGVYYTPKPVVDYIVKSVDWILRNKFNKKKGLADDSVHLLDPATGTGTFLMSVIQEIYLNIKKENEALGEEMVRKEFNSIVSNHILKHFYGFELLIAPYAIAHLKLTLEVERLGFEFALTKGDSDKDNDRFKVYLANTLDDPEKPPLSLFGFDSIPQESESARKVKKDAPILAIIGNPPYSKITTNLDNYMKSLVERYKYIDGIKVKEKGALQLEINLNDDYVKFIAFAQKKILQSREGGIVALITNHNYLDNPTLYAMRHNLISSFSEIYILNLNGNSKKKKTSLQKDENVFNIQQGVCISFFIKRKEVNTDFAKTYYFSLEGDRISKYSYLLENSIRTTKYELLSPVAPHYVLVHRNDEHEAEFNGFPKITELFPKNSAGIITARDNLVLDWSVSKLLEKIEKYRGSKKSNDELASELDMSVKKGWDMTKSRRALKAVKDIKRFVKTVLYRPFMCQRIFYHPTVVWSMSQPVMKQMFYPNLALIFTRQVTGLQWAHVQVATSLVEIKSNSHDRSSQVAPLYIYEDSASKDLFSASSKRPNLSASIIKDISNKLKLTFISNGCGDFKKTYGPEDVFYYAYAVLHSLKYRIRYAEQLKIDFPRLPLTSDKMLFKKLVQLGNELVHLHLLGENPFDNSKTIFDDSKKWDVRVGGTKPENLEDWKVIDVRYDEKTKRVYVNSGQYFEGIEKEVWEFMIGGYQVCEKWLKDRKKAERFLSTDDLRHCMKTVVALRETIRIMKEIDQIIPKWPIQ